MVDKKELLRSIISDHNESGMDSEEKLKTLGPLLSLLDKNLTETEFRLWLDIYEIPVVDPVIERLARNYLNLLHYSGLIRLREPLEDSWLDPGSDDAFRGSFDAEAIEMVNVLEADVLELSKHLG